MTGQANVLLDMEKYPEILSYPELETFGILTSYI